MAITRSALVNGPCKLIYDDDTTLWSEGDVEYSVETDTLDFKVGMFGTVDKAVTDQRVKVPFTPASQLTTAIAAVLFPTTFRNPTIGTRLCGDADLALKIWGTDEQLHTIHNAVLTKPPELMLGSDKSLFGAAEFTGLVANELDVEEESALYTIADSEEDPGGEFTKADYLSGARWTGTFGSFLTGIVAEDGWSLACEPQLAPVKIDGVTRDFKITGVVWRAKCIPHGSTADTVAAASSVARKAEGGLATVGTVGKADLVITNGSKTITLENAIMLTHGFRFGASVLRNGEVGWEAATEFSTGTRQALVTFSL